jgi:outer membrane protein assembly factor BamB
VRVQFALALLLLVAGSVFSGCDLFSEGEQVAEVVWTIPKQIQRSESIRPVIEDGTAYVAYDTRLQAIDAATGRVRWTREVNLTRGGNRFTSRKLLHDGDRLFINQAGMVMAFAKADGRALWSVTIPDFTPDGFDKPAQDDEFLYVATSGVVQQVRKADGSLGRRFDVGAFAAEGTAKRATDVDVTLDGILIVPVTWSEDGETFGAHGAVYGFDTATGEERWRFETSPWEWTAPTGAALQARVGATGAAVGDGRAYVTTYSQVLGVDPTTGDVLWEQRMHSDDTGGFWVGPTAANGGVFVGGIREYAHRIDGATGEVVWSQKTDGSMQPILTVRDGRVYFTNNGWGELWVLDEQTGEPIWHDQPPGHEANDENYFSPPAVGENHMVVVGNKYIYGLTKP